MTRKFPALVLLAGAVALAGCTDPYAPRPPGAPTNAQTGAIAGAMIGGFLGATAEDDDDRLARTAAGALIGGALGGGIGSVLDRQEAELRQQLGSNVQIVNTGSALVVTMPQDILFATDSAVLRPDLQADLYAVARNLNAYPNSRIEVIGHTDSTGSSSYNLGLSTRRANAVAAVLMQSGVAPGRIDAIGRGEAQPVASNLNEAGRAQNRRVEIIIRPTG
ncbi:MAG: OmpA family protein [Rhodobacteraceae bacterium]|nr:OmpA family protein [Paracoccaceae bacterium]